jgi:hypothetical protein
MHASGTTVLTGLRSRVGGGRTVSRLSWLFVATLPNSGSTALAGLLDSAPRTVRLTARGEGQWLLPEMCAPGRRWDPAAPLDLGRVRRVWSRHARAGLALGPRLVIEKSPPNLCRFRALLDAFADMPVGVLRFTRDPYAVCASWARRYPPAKIVVDWAPELAGRIDGEEAFFRALGAICGQRMRLLAGLEDCSDLDLSYEALTADPAASASALAGAFPLLSGLDPQVSVAVKDYAPQRLRNRNAEQVAALSPRQLAAITDGLEPHAAAVMALGYRLRAPGGGGVAQPSEAGAGGVTGIAVGAASSA